MLDVLVLILPFILPMSLTGELFGNAIICFAGTLYLLKLKGFKVNLKMLFLMIAMVLIAIISYFISGQYAISLQGISLYIITPVYYMVASNLLNEKHSKLENKKTNNRRVNSELILESNYRLINYIIYAVTIVAIFHIGYEAVLYKVRAYGSLGYANSYGLLILGCIYLIRITKNLKCEKFINTILISTIFFTGSRSTMFFLIVFIFTIIFTGRNKDNSSNYVKFKLLGSLIAGIILYLLIEKLSLLGVILAPIILYIQHQMGEVIKKCKSKRIIYLFLIVAVICIASIVSSNTFTRVGNISVQNGSFQERLIIFEDVFKSIQKNPLGHGINTLQINEQKSQSAFYDVRYAHNSVLQTSYDIGVIGGLALIILFAYGSYELFKNAKEKTWIHLVMFIIVFLHSLLDFDFSYGTIMVFISFILILGGGEYKEIKCEKSYKFLAIPVILLSLIIFYLQGIVDVSRQLINYGQEQTAINLLKKAPNFDIVFKDWRRQELAAKAYKNIYDDTEDIEFLKSSRIELENSLKVYENNVSIKRNLSYVYVKLNNTEEALKLKAEAVKDERFYFEAYKDYYNYLDKLYSEKKDVQYKANQEELKELYYRSLKELNPKSKYIKNQLKTNFEEILNLEVK